MDEKDKLKRTISYIVDVIETQVKSAKLYQKDCLEDGLTWNAIEGEGYLRACLTIKEEISAYDDTLFYEDYVGD